MPTGSGAVNGRDTSSSGIRKVIFDRGLLLVGGSRCDPCEESLARGSPPSAGTLTTPVATVDTMVGGSLEGSISGSEVLLIRPSPAPRSHESGAQ